MFMTLTLFITGPEYDIFKAMYFSLEGEAREAFAVEAKENTKLIFEVGHIRNASS